MKEVAGFVLGLLTFASCQRPSLSVRLEKANGMLIASASGPLATGAGGTSEGDVPGGGFEYYSAKVTQITASEAALDLLVIYVPEGRPIKGRPIYHHVITVPRSGTPAVIKPFDDLQFRAKIFPGPAPEPW